MKNNSYLSPVISLIMCMFFQLPAFGQEETKIIIGEKFKIHSDTLNEDRPYWIYLPDSYDDNVYSDKQYPVLFLLDGDQHFHSASGIVQYMSSGCYYNKIIPELIVVAIPHEDRNKDLTPTYSLVDFDGKENHQLESSGGGKKFLNFIAYELLPRIEQDYRTMPYRVLVGHSLGGLLAVYSFITTPDLFDAVIAIDPALYWDNELCLKELGSEPHSGIIFNNTFYMSTAHNTPYYLMPTEPFRLTQERFYYKLKEKSTSQFHSKFQYFEEENHMSVPLLSLYYGLSFVFDWYYISEGSGKELSYITHHFDSISVKLGIKILPPQDMINEIGWYHIFRTGNLEKAFAFFNTNVQNYPTSYQVYVNMAEAYQESGRKKEAIKYFRKALELNPESEYILNAIKELNEN